MMTSFMKRPITAFVIGIALSSAACGEEDLLDDDLDPIFQTDGGQPPGSFSDAATVGNTDAGFSSFDAGNVTAFDASGNFSDAQPSGSDASSSDASSSDAANPGNGGATGGSCCSGGDCLCHGPAPTALTSARGPYKTANFTVAGTGCVFYPTDAEPPFAAVAVSDGFVGTGGCNSIQTGQWAPLYASWGIVAMIIDTGGSDQPNVRGQKLLKGIAAFKSENTKSGSPLFGKMSGRYGTSGFSMGGGGTSYATRD